MDDAWETIRFAIFNDLIGQMPPDSFPYLEQAARVAAEALKQPEYSWVFKELAQDKDTDHDAG